MGIPNAETYVWRKSSYSDTGGDCVEVTTWHKSSHSSSTGECVEVATWNKSSHSGSQGECVEMRRNTPGTTAIRDSKNTSGPHLTVGADAWDSFLTSLKDDASATV
ncbi:DUF397 domain-containing protein [Streptomyces lunalinharesii]|uniref:DUF397 domain-containing protein n=1 Tax=Streptomyces lunalinharesii TaxID=333384 RepID=A0ABN3SKY3_9ACTN